MQKPVDVTYHNFTVTGVPVQLIAIDPSGGVIDLGVVTSDMSGSFGTSWTPQNEGVYRVYSYLRWRRFIWQFLG